MKAILIFASASAALILGSGVILATLFRAPGERRAIGLSAGVAFVVQLVAFAIAKRSAATNVMAGWGLGAILRFAALGVYALVVVRALALPSGAALVSLACFFFLSTLVEPLLLKS